MNDSFFPGGAYPAGGFLQSAIEYATPLTEAVPHFHLSSALVTLSTVIGKNIFIQWGDKKLYPNLYVCLIGQSSISRKSTSANIQKRLLREFNKNLLLPDQYSAEKLISSLQKSPTGTFYIDEFGGFLQNCSNKSYLAGTIELLTELYECPPIFRRSLQSQEYEVESPCLSILATSTLDWLMKNIQEKDIRGGFFPRFLFFISNQTGQPIPFPPPPNLELRQDMILELQEISRIKGQATVSGSAKARYEAWYIQNFNDLQKEDSILTGAFTRLTDYCVKIALLYELSATKGLEISEDSMIRAIRLIKYLKNSLRNLITKEMTFSKEMEKQKKVFDIINKKPRISGSELLRISHLTSKELRPVIETLIESEQIISEIHKSDGNKPTRTYSQRIIQEGNSR